MNVLQKSMKRAQEAKEVAQIKAIYKRSPKEKCPLCNKKSLFYTNKDGSVFCVRCDSRVTIKSK